jgi:hypothetical protein
MKKIIELGFTNFDPWAEDFFLSTVHGRIFLRRSTQKNHADLIRLNYLHYSLLLKNKNKA